VVVKLILPEHTEDDRIVQMFVREARILAQLRHPSLVDVLEFGEQDGGYVLVLEYVRGYHLGLWLRYLAEKRRTAPTDIVLQIVIDVLDALHHAHTQLHPDGSSMQIVHRDVSPSNILLDEAGRGRLLDFGVARMRGGAQEIKTQVQGGFMGKLPYTAPEIFAGAEASPQSDLYACAVVIHEAIIGRNVFRGETQAATLQRVLSHAPETLASVRPEISAELDKVLARALAKSPTERQADAHELSADLRKLQKASESEIRSQLADLLKDDFGLELSKLFNLESLADRDDAWRRLSVASPLAPRPTESRQPTTDGAPASNVQRSIAAPVPAGATAVARSTRRTNTQGESATPPAQRTGTRSVTSTPALAPAPAPPPANDVQPHASSAATRANDPQPDQRSDARPSKRLQLYALGIAAALAAAGIGAQLVSTHAPSEPASGANDPAGTPTLFHPARPVHTTPTIPETTVRTEPPQPPLATPTKPPGQDSPDSNGSEKPRPTKAAGPDPNALTRALRRQRTKLEACFNTHSLALEGHATTQLIFDLAEDGSQTKVELSPPLLTQTELGQCLLKVARATRFPPQPHAVSFAIPLTASTSKQ
jgi:serine/threonine-protein kinase